MNIYAIVGKLTYAAAETDDVCRRSFGRTGSEYNNLSQPLYDVTYTYYYLFSFRTKGFKKKKK